MPFDEEELDPHGECAAEIARLRAGLSRLQAAYNNKEISGSLWDTKLQVYVSLPIFFERLHQQQRNTSNAD